MKLKKYLLFWRTIKEMKKENEILLLRLNSISKEIKIHDSKEPRDWYEKSNNAIHSISKIRKELK